MTTDRERTRLAEDLAELATRLAVAITTRDGHGHTAVDRIKDGLAGQPGAQRLQSDRTTGFTTVLDDDGMPIPAVSDPTGETVVNYLTSRTKGDPAGQDLARLDKAIRSAHDLIAKAVDILATYTPRPANAHDRRQLEKTNTKPDPVCESCIRTESAKGVTRGMPVHRTGTVNGNLDQPTALCRWCYDYVRTTGKLPTEAVLADYYAGKRIYTSVS